MFHAMRCLRLASWFVAPPSCDTASKTCQPSDVGLSAAAAACPTPLPGAGGRAGPPLC